MIREDHEMTAVKVQVEPFWAKRNRRSYFVYLPVTFVVFVQSWWRVGNRVTVFIRITCIIMAPKASTDNYAGSLGSWYTNTAAADVRAHFTAQKAFSQLCDQFQGVFPMSSYRGWASVDNLGIKLFSAANVSRKERLPNGLDLFVGWLKTMLLKSAARKMPRKVP